MSTKFKFKILKQADPQAQYNTISVKDPMTVYLLSTGVGYLGDVKLFDATTDGLVQSITDENTSTTDAASVKAIVDYVAAKMSAINALNIKFFRGVKSHTLTADDIANENVKVPEDAKEGDVGLLFTADTDNEDNETETWYFISLVNYLNTVYSFVNSKTIAFTVNEDNSVSAEVKIADTETSLKTGDKGLFIEKVTEINTDNPSDKPVTEKAIVAYLQDALSQVVTYSVDDGTDA